MSNPMRHTLPIVMLLLAGCSLLKTDAGGWTRPNATAAETSAHLESCRRVANAKVGEDAKIQQDMNSGQMSPGTMNEGDLQSDLNQYGLKKRYHKLVDDCMKAQGYVRGTKG
jgi:hypothetical protein